MWSRWGTEEEAVRRCEGEVEHVTTACQKNVEEEEVMDEEGVGGETACVGGSLGG